MKDSILKKIISLLLSVTLAVGMNGVPVWAEGSAGSENGIAGDVEFTVEMDGRTWSYQKAEEFEKAWKMVKGQTAVIRLKQGTVDVGGMDFDDDDDHDNDNVLFVKERQNTTLIIDAGAKLCNDNYDGGGTQLIGVSDGGTFILRGGGTISSTGYALTVGDGNVRIEEGITLIGGMKEGSGCETIHVSDGKNLQIGECIITAGNTAGAIYMGDTELSVCDMLASGYAFKKNGGGWVTRSEDLKNAVGVKNGLAEFTQQPESITTTYGEIPTLHATAFIKDKNIGEKLSYQWQQKQKDGSWEDVEGADAKNKDFTLSNTLPVDNHPYRCQAKLGDWFYLNSEEVSITVQPQIVGAEIKGDVEKEYDGTTEVKPEQLLSVKLNGVLNSDIISGSAVSWYYDNKNPGERTIFAEIELIGYGKENYQLSSSKISTSGKIIGVNVTGVSLDTHSLNMTAGMEKQLIASVLPKDASNKNLSWTSSNPAVASVDSNGKVTSVSAGSAVIRVTTEDGEHTDSCTVTVGIAGNSGGTSGGSSGSPSTNIRLPFLKAHPYKRGWGVIQAEAEKAVANPESGTAYIDIDMNGTVLVPGRIFTAVKNKDVTLAFDMGGGISWSVCGKDITAETVSDTNLSVKAGGGVIPLDVLNRTAGDCAHLELSPAHNGPFGFTAALTLQTGKNENGIAIGAGDKAAFAGMYANLYAYNTSLRSLEFVCAEQVGEDGTVHLPVDRASDFTVILSADPMGGTDTPEDPSGGQNEIEPEPENLPVGSVELSKTLYTYSGKAKKPAVTAVDTAGMQIPDKYYTVSYQNNIKVGKAAAVIVFKDGYSGTVEKAFTIRPAGTSIKKAAAVSGGFTLKWTKRTAQTSGYQIQYTRNSGFKGSSTKRVNVKKVSVTKKTVKKLKNGKKYYVRIRTYKKVKTGGTNTRVYSAWSRAAALRVK